MTLSVVGEGWLNKVSITNLFEYVKSGNHKHMNYQENVCLIITYHFMKDQWSLWALTNTFPSLGI